MQIAYRMESFEHHGRTISLIVDIKLIVCYTKNKENERGTEMDGRKHNRGTVGNRGGGRPATGQKPRHTVSADAREWSLIRRFIQIVRKDTDAAERMLDYEKNCLR